MQTPVVAEIRAAGGSAEASYDSVSSKEGADAIIGKALSAFGRVDVLLNNAGLFARQDPTQDEPRENGKRCSMYT